MFLAGVVGVLVVIAAVFFLTDNGKDKKDDDAKASVSPSVSVRTDLPPGVKCAGASCTGNEECGDQRCSHKRDTTPWLATPARRKETHRAKSGDDTQTL